MKTEQTDTGTLETWSVDEVDAALNAGDIALIDVRTAAEYTFEHIEGALLAPMSHFRADRLPSQQGKRLVFHCGSGVRSEKVARKCLAAGITPVAHMEGGFGAWKAAKKPYITTDMATGGLKVVEGG
ncbi:rhodanese-like domain-containing protein [Maribius pontilimi]|uniref:Rhodanese-like domain-containing protein n=1 Tax=Palleronia pontilimi TaxID=1964209 RepID=A0A934I7A4_9RHOB|nr:rhodanese-like domain-containing protein [Palleronia pontilimi]MBJ3761558.1 rhodanese-like domain-containing protein [Palleronia pontilimi]